MNIGFEDFKLLANDDTLSKNEKIGFPDTYRDGYDQKIYQDIVSKIGLIQQNNTILDIGPGCSELTNIIIQESTTRNADLTLIDSEEMLNLLPNKNGVKKIVGFFPSTDVKEKLERQEKFDKIICYSVFHYLFVEADILKFLDYTLELLKPGGRFLLADIPNQSMRYRFFSSSEGVKFQEKYIGTTSSQRPVTPSISSEHIDDAVLFGMITRARSKGYHGYIVPQHEDLPMSNRREDLLFIKP